MILRERKYTFTKGTHGIHIHEIGDISNNCAASGHIHGALGNIEADSSGNANIDIEVHDSKTSLFGANTVIGHTVVIHEGGETVGLRLACGIITDSTGFSSEAIQNLDLSVIVGLGKVIKFFGFYFFLMKYTQVSI